MVKSMNIDMILQTKDKSYIDPLNVFNKLSLSMMVPFVQIEGFVKTFNDAFIPNSWNTFKTNTIFMALRNIQIPEKARMYSVNQGNFFEFPLSTCLLLKFETQLSFLLNILLEFLYLLLVDQIELYSLLSTKFCFFD